MKKILFASIALVAMSLSVSAGTIPLCGAGGQETVTSVKAKGATGCMVGDKIFANFADYTPAGPQAIPGAWQVNLTSALGSYFVDFVQDNAGNPLSNPALTGGLNTWGVQYTVAIDLANYPYQTITNIGLSQNGGTGTGGTAKIEKFVYDNLGNQLAYLVTPGSFVSISITPSTWISVKELITLQNAQTTAFTDRIQQTAAPEPATYAMMGLGLAALGLIARRKKA